MKEEEKERKGKRGEREKDSFVSHFWWFQSKVWCSHSCDPLWPCDAPTPGLWYLIIFFHQHLSSHSPTPPVSSPSSRSFHSLFPSGPSSWLFKQPLMQPRVPHTCPSVFCFLDFAYSVAVSCNRSGFLLLLPSWNIPLPAARKNHIWTPRYWYFLPVCFPKPS